MIHPRKGESVTRMYRYEVSVCLVIRWLEGIQDTLRLACMHFVHMPLTRVHSEGFQNKRHADGIRLYGYGLRSLVVEVTGRGCRVPPVVGYA